MHVQNTGMKNEELDEEVEFEQVVTYRDRVSNVSAKGKRNWVFAEKPKGWFYTLRHYFSLFYFLTFFSIPLMKINGMPLLMLNFPEGKFIIFTKIFWPQDFFIFAVAMITGIIFIALFTVIYGRIFCGWVCPQTVFMEMMFRKLEWWIEGSYLQQQKLDKQEWNTDKIIKRGGKHLVFFLLSFLIANTFLAYILGLDGLLKAIREPFSEHILLLSGLLLFTFLFYAVFAFVRDIVCTTICPYGRLQSVLFDKDTMQVAYDYKRGEPRGRNSVMDTQLKGDCIDCNKCVHVCPTGIDIRNGVQMECIGCTACMDACDEVMLKIKKPKGLIRYASENQIAHGGTFRFNGRMKAYTILLSALSLFMVVLIATRHSIDTYISRSKGQLYQELPHNKLSNLYSAKIINKTNKEVDIELKIENAEGEVRMLSQHETHLKKEALNELTFFIILDKGQIHQRNTKLKIGIYNKGKKIETVSTTFLGPFI
jgi:cytochrome c oxidase accessory protein FixG